MVKRTTLGTLGDDLRGMITKLAQEEIEAFDKALNATTIDRYSKIIKDTPVDTGRLRGAWLLDQYYSPTEKGKPDRNKGSAYLRRKISSIGGLLGKRTYFFNNLPYAEVVEYGLYPNPVKRGSKKRKGKGYVKYSEGGYSKQAPMGMMRINLAQFAAEVGRRFKRYRKR